MADPPYSPPPADSADEPEPEPEPEPGGEPDPGDEPASAGDRPAWPLWIAPAGVVLGFLLATFGTVVVDAVATVGGSSLSRPSPAANIIADIVFDLCFVGVALWLTGWRHRPRAADFGYRPVRLRTGAAAVALGAIGYYGVTAIYGALIKTNQTDKLPSDLGVTHSTAALVAAAIFVCAIAPMAEEFFFRGFLFGTLRTIPLRVAGRDGGPWLAAVITGLLFGAAHLGSAPAVYLIPLGFLGFVLCLIRWRTRSLYPCMALHSANNALALGVNQLSWSAAAILGLMLASWLAIGVITGPLATRTPRPA